MSEELKSWLARVSDPGFLPWSERDEEGMPALDDSASVEADPMAGFETRGSGQEEEEEDFSYRGGRDADGRPHGGGTVQWDNGDAIMCDFHRGVREGDGVVVCPREGVARLCGKFVRGKLEGRGKLIRMDTSVTDCFFRRSVMHGPARRIDIKKFREFRRQLAFLGRYRNGRPWGTCWLYKEGGGFLVGVVDGSGEFSGDNLTYIYPDMRSAFVGRFSRGVMVSARTREVVGASSSGDGGFVPVPVFSPESDGDGGGDAVGYSCATRSSVGQNPLVPDPYESRTVQVGPSSFPGAGEGLFARRDLPAGTLVAFYNGVRIPYALGGPKEEWSTSGYKIFINADFTSGERMDIPNNLTDTGRYRATLGHKVNHSFVPNCDQWFFDHPRFGVVPCQRAIRQISAGEEVTMDYEYDPYNCPEWFRKALLDFVAGASEENLEKLNSKYDRFVRSECRMEGHRKFVFPKLDGADFVT